MKEVRRLYCFSCREYRMGRFVGKYRTEKGTVHVYELECGHRREVKYRSGRKLVLITVHLAPATLERLRFLIRLGRFPNVSEAIRYAVHELLVHEFQAIEREKALIRYFKMKAKLPVGAVSLGRD